MGYRYSNDYTCLGCGLHTQGTNGIVITIYPSGIRSQTDIFICRGCARGDGERLCRETMVNLTVHNMAKMGWPWA